MQIVHVRINDAATAQPSPCRARFTDAEGRYFAPLGRLSEFPDCLPVFAEGNIYDGSEAWAVTGGAFEIPLPPGRTSVQISKGLEFRPYADSFDLVPGKLAMRFALERWTDCRQDRWFSGDSRVHCGNPHELLLSAAAEDLAVVNLLAEQAEFSPTPLFPNIIAFSGQKPCLETPGHMVVVNTHNVHPELGSLGLLHCHRVVYPLRLGEPAFEKNWTLADWCDQCHRKNGLVVWTDTAEAESRLDSEVLADMILGKVDAFEITSTDEKAVEPWYAILNAGFRLPLIGGSGARTNDAPIGRPRTYAQLMPDQPLTYSNWIEAVRSGRTFITSGPLLSFTVDEHGPGSALKLLGSRKVIVEAETRSACGFKTLELVCDAKVIASASLDDHGFPRTARLRHELVVAESGWLAVRCLGMERELLAHSSPVYLECPLSANKNRRDALALLQASLAGVLARGEKRPWWNDALLLVLKNASDILTARLNSPNPV